MPWNRSTRHLKLAGCLLGSAFLTACAKPEAPTAPRQSPGVASPTDTAMTPRQKVVANALSQTTVTLAYDPAYAALTYPNGDVPLSTGVCADVVIRAMRAAGVDLQKEVHEDMTRAFDKYPSRWGAKSTDANIDHRRVANLMTWFTRQQKNLAPSDEATAYQPGDIVAWELNQETGQLHIGLVSDIKVANTNHYAIVHNINAGAQLSDVLFAWKTIGHYRYFTDEKPIRPRPHR